MAIIDKPSDYFETVLWSSVDTSIDTLDFQPDWVWIKSRTNADTQVLFDSVRSAGKRLSSSSTGAESTKTDELTAFNSDGFTLGTGSNVNRASNNNVAWCWKAGTSFTNDASATGIGSIDSTGSVNQDARFSIVSFTGGGANATIKHGLTSKPSMIIVKARGQASTWSVYHASLGATKFLRLESTNSVGTETGWWNNTEPTSSVFSIGTNYYANTHIAYCFAEKQGYSKISSFVGNNNADGTFVYTGFSPSWVMIKCTTTGSTNWIIVDNKRPGFNVISANIRANTNGAENTNNDIDLLSNGFKLRTNDNDSNIAQTYIYMAFAENPFVTSTGVPATAR